MTDGTHLWVVNNSSTDKLFKYTLSGTLVGSWTIHLGNSTPTGLTLDPSNASQHIWIVDSGTDCVYQYSDGRTQMSGGLAAFVTFTLAAGNTNPQGIADPLPPRTVPASRVEIPVSHDAVITSTGDWVNKSSSFLPGEVRFHSGHREPGDRNAKAQRMDEWMHRMSVTAGLALELPRTGVSTRDVHMDRRTIAESKHAAPDALDDALAELAAAADDFRGM